MSAAQPSPPPAPAPARCPLCDAPNGCAMAAGARDAAGCWCMQARVAPEALARVPAAQRGAACLCPRCARG